MAQTFKIFLVTLQLAIVGCHIHPIGVRQPVSEQELEAYLRELNEYHVNQVSFDYMAECRIRMKTKKETVSGSCDIVITDAQQLRINVYSPVGGLELAIYMDEELLQALIKSRKSFYKMENNDNNRKKLLFVDLKVGELQEALWGRKISRNKTDLKFRLKNNRPYRIESVREDRRMLVYYRNWLEYKGAIFPKTIEIEDIQRNVFIKLVITQLRLGHIEKLKISDIPPDYQIRS